MTARSPESCAFGPFRFVCGDGLWRDGHVVPLPPRALGVLTALLATPGVVVSKQSLMDAVWPGTFVTDSSLLEAIGLLRDALGDDRRHPTYIQTAHRRGYRFIGEITEPSRVLPSFVSAEARSAEPEGSPERFFSGEQWRPIVVASAAYAITAICVAIVFAVLGRQRPESIATDLSIDAPRFAIAHTGELVYVPAVGAPVVPAWTPSGLEIAFAFSKAGPFNLLITPTDGTDPLLASRGRMFPTSWSPDHTRLAFTEHQPLSGADIWVFDLRTRSRRALAHTWSDETWARFSPDGRWIAYMSNESGRWEVYVQSADGDDRRIRVSSQGGAWPSWSSDGATVFFSTAGATMASMIRTTPLLAAATPSVVGLSGSHGSAELRAFLEWFSELAAHVGPG